MFQITQDTLKRAGALILGTILGRGILLFLGGIGIHPEEWVATMLGIGYANLKAIAWILAGVGGFVALAFWEIVQRRLAPAGGTIQHRPHLPTPTNSVAGDAKPVPDMLVKEAAEYLAATKASWDAASDEVWKELREAARAGRITVWGRPESAHLERPYKPREKIPPNHWRHYAFNFLRCMYDEDETRCRTEPDDPKRYPLNNGYADLRVNRTQVQSTWVAKIPLDALTIEIGDGAPFNTYVERLHTKTHLIRIGVINGLQGKAVTNCQLRLEQITGPSSDRCPVTIKQNFIINGGATEYISLAEFDERIDKAAPAPSKLGPIRLPFPLTSRLSNDMSYLDAGCYELTLLATSAETPPARQRGRLVMSDGFLSLQRL